MKAIEFMQTRNTFSMICTVKASIHTSKEVIWSLLTDAKEFSRWNSTVSKIDGSIKEGERIRIHVPGTSRVFKPIVSGVEINKRMIWSNGAAPIFKGTRTFELMQTDKGVTDFIMEEKFEGVVYAMLKNRLPDFRLIFERYAFDLKKEAERRAS